MEIRQIIKTTVILAAAIVLSGCIRDSLDDCECDITLHFQYHGDGASDIFPAKINQVDMFVYNASDNSIAGEYMFDKDALTEFQGARLSLKAGDYRIVSWGNAFDKTEINKEHPDARVAEPAHFASTKSSDVFSGTDSLYFNVIEITVPESLQDVEETCFFESAHIKIWVHVVGFFSELNGWGEDVEFSMIHSPLPEYTDFTNTPAQEHCEIFPEFGTDPKDPTSAIYKYNTLRFTEDHGHALMLAVNGDTFYSVDMKEFIQNHNIQVDGKQEVLIGVRIVMTGTDIEVLEWNVQDVNPGFDRN